MLRGSRKFEAKLQSAGVLGVVGSNGSGKSLLAARLMRASLDAGRPVLSTAALYDDDGNVHPLCTIMTNLGQLLTWRGDVWLDEITTVAGAREASNLPVQIQARLQQLRKDDVRVVWTAPSFQRADTILREVSTVIVYAQGFVPEKRRNNSLWRPRRLFFFKAYDARAVTEWDAKQASQHARKGVRRKPLARELFWRPGSKAERSYKTLDPVSVISAGGTSGVCLTCSGTIRRPVCQGHAVPA